MTRSKRKLKKVSAGFVMLGIVAPGKQGWVYSTRALLLVPKDYPTKPSAREFAPLTKRNIARAVARFAAYPKGLLTRDLGRTARLLETRGQHRLLRFGGAFSGQPSSKRTGNGAGRYLDS